MNYHINKAGDRLLIRQPKGRSFEIVMLGLVSGDDQFNFHVIEQELGVKFNWLASELRKLCRRYKVRRFVIEPYLFDGNVFEASWNTRDYRHIPSHLFRIHVSEASIRDEGTTKFIEGLNSFSNDLDAIW